MSRTDFRGIRSNYMSPHPAGEWLSRDEVKTQLQCAVEECEEPRIHPEIPYCHEHTTDLIIAAIQATMKGSEP